MATFNCMQKRPADDEGLHIDVKFTGLAGSDTEVDGSVFEYQSVFSAVANFTECNESGEPIGEVLMETLYFSDETNFNGKPVTSVQNGLLLPTTPAARAGHEDVVLKHPELLKNPNKLYKCWLDFYIDGGATNALANSDTVISSNEFIVMGKALASPTLVRDLKAPDDKNIYLTANWGNLPLSQKIITIRNVADKTTMKGTSVNLVSLDSTTGNFVNAGNGEQKIILCAALPATSATVKELNSVVKVDSNQNYWVLFTTLAADKTYSINAKVITRGLVQSATSPSVTVGYNPGAFEAPTIVAVRPGLTVNNVKMYFKAPVDVLTLKNLITPEIPDGLTLQSYKVTKEASVTFSFSGKMRKNGLEASANLLDLLDDSLVVNTKPFVAGTTLKVDGSVYNRGASDKLAGETDITDCYVVDKTFANLSYEGVPLTIVTFGLTAAYSGYKEQPQTCSATHNLLSVNLAVAPVINKVEILQDIEKRKDSKGKDSFNYATGNITIKVAGQRMTNNFTGVTDRVNLYWGLTEDLQKIRDGVARYTDAMGQVVPAVPARALLAGDFTKVTSPFSTSLPTDATELNVFGNARNYVIKMSQTNIPGTNGQDITFYATLQSSDSDVSTFDENKVTMYTKQASSSSPANFTFELTNSNQLKATLREVNNFGLGSETVKGLTDLIKNTEDYKVTANTNLKKITDTAVPTVVATQIGLSEFNASVDSIYKVLSVKDKYAKAIIAINAVSEAAKIVGDATTLTTSKWGEVNTKLTTAVNATLPIPPATTTTTISPSAAATDANLNALREAILLAANAAANAFTNFANSGPALTQLALTASEALKAIKTIQLTLQSYIANYDMSDLNKRLAKATELEKNAKVIIGYKSWTTGDQQLESNAQIKFIELSVNGIQYNNLIDVDVGYYLLPEGGDAEWKAGKTVEAWIEAINVKSIFNGNYTFETIKATSIQVPVLKVPAQVINETAIPLDLSEAGAFDTTGNIRYKFTEPEAGDATKNFKIVYKRNGSSAPVATYYFTTVSGNNQGELKDFEVIIYKSQVAPAGGLALTPAGTSGSYTSVTVDQFNTIYMAHEIGTYEFGDLITADIYNIGVSGVLATVYKTLNLVPAKPATIDSIEFSSPPSGTYTNDDIVTYTISNNGSAIESLYSLDVFGNLLLPTSVEPVTQFTFETNNTIYSGSVVNAISTVKSDGSKTTLYTDKSTTTQFNAQFKTVNTNALIFKPPTRVVKGGDLSVYQPDYLVSNVISCEASGSSARVGAAVPEKTVIVLKYDTSEAKLKGGSTAGLQAVFAILYSKQTTQQNIPSYKLQTVTQASAQTLPAVK